MSGVTAAAVAYAALLVSAAAIEIRARRAAGPATAAEAVAAAMRTTPGRAAVLLAWVWLGVHFLAR